MADSTSTFFQLPPELRLEIYRRVFFIYPNTRTRVGEFKLDEHNGNVPCKAFEVYIHPTKAHASVYRAAPREYRSQEDQHRLHEYRHTPQEFLAIFSVSKAVYREAMPLFYSETFFCFLETGHSISPTSFLYNIGPPREQHVRRVSFELIPLNYPCTLEDRPSLKWAALFLSFAKHIDLLEIILFVGDERLEFGEKLINFARPSLGDEVLILDLLWGFQHLLALGNVGAMRLVGDPARLLRNPDDRLLLEGVKGKALFDGDTGYRPLVVFEHPPGIDEL